MSESTKTGAAAVPALEGRAAQPESKAPKTDHKQHGESKKLTRDHITVFATIDPDMEKAITASAAERGHVIVRLEDKIIDDFLAARSAPTPEQTEVKQVSDFINDKNNKALAEDRAKSLYTALTREPIENHPGLNFKFAQVVKRTNLSWGKARAVLEMLEAFGFVEWLDVEKKEFVFSFEAAAIHRTVRRQALAMMTETAKDFVRYKALLENDESLTKEQRKAEVSALKAEFRRLLA